MRQVNKSMFERAFHSHLQEKGHPAVKGPAPKSKDLPLFYISLTLSILVYLGLLVVGPKGNNFENWFPNLQKGTSVASQSGIAETR